MKFCAIILIAFVVLCTAADHLSDKQREAVKQVGKACIEKTGAAEEAVKKLRSGDFTSADPKTKCFVNCFTETLGFIKDGVPQEDVLREKIGPLVGQAHIDEIGKTCNGLRGGDNCETAYKIYECYFKQNPSAVVA